MERTETFLLAVFESPDSKAVTNSRHCWEKFCCMKTVRVGRHLMIIRSNLMLYKEDWAPKKGDKVGQGLGGSPSLSIVYVPGIMQVNFPLRCTEWLLIVLFYSFPRLDTLQMFPCSTGSLISLSCITWASPSNMSVEIISCLVLQISNPASHIPTCHRSNRNQILMVESWKGGE